MKVGSNTVSNVVSKGQEFFKNILDKLNLKKKAIAFCVENWSQFKSWVKYSLSLKKNGSGGYPSCPDEHEYNNPETIGELIKREKEVALQAESDAEEKLSSSDAQEEAVSSDKTGPVRIEIIDYDHGEASAKDALVSVFNLGFDQAGEMLNNLPVCLYISEEELVEADQILFDAGITFAVL